MDPFWFQSAPTLPTSNNWSSCTYYANFEHDSYSCPYLYENPPHQAYVHHNPYNHTSSNASPSSYHDYRELHVAYPSPYVESPSPVPSLPSYGSPESLHGYGQNEFQNNPHFHSVEPYPSRPLSFDEQLERLNSHINKKCESLKKHITHPSSTPSFPDYFLFRVIPWLCA